MPGIGVFDSRPWLKAAVDAWIADPTAAEEEHGPISTWNTALVSDMTQLFKCVVPAPSAPPPPLLPPAPPPAPPESDL